MSEVAGKRLQKRHNLTGPQGVRGRNSDNTLVRKVLGWEPSTFAKGCGRPTHGSRRSCANNGGFLRVNWFRKPSDFATPAGSAMDAGMGRWD